MPPDQYTQQWQQWQQYQQQYAQWHAQYGEQYARQIGQPVSAVPTPAIPMPTTAPHPAPYGAPPPTLANPPPPPSEPHPDTLAARKRSAPPPPVEDEQSQKTAEELAFDEQFRKWEEEFENWKSKNANHPDKTAYHEYEKKFVECRKKLVERREQLRKKRIAELAAAKASAPPVEHTGLGMGLFANALGGGGGGGGIPGLDLLNENRAVDRKKPPVGEVTEIIELDDDNDNDIKPDLNRINDRLATSNPVTALASLLKDPKVSALLNIITNNSQTGQPALPSLPAGQADILQKLHSAAGAVVNANGGLGAAPPAQQQAPFPPLGPVRTPSMHSGDERSRDIDDFNRGRLPQPPLPAQPPNNGLNFAGIPGVAAPPPNFANNGFNFGVMPGPAAPPPGMVDNGFNFGGMPAAPPAVAPESFNAGPPLPLMSLDLSRPPPMQGSPAPSNASSSASQNRPSRWGQQKPPKKQQQKKQDAEPPFNGVDFPQEQGQPRSSRWGMKGPPPQKQQQQPKIGPKPPARPSFNGADASPSKEPVPVDPTTLPNYYSGHLNELQVDPELGTPCAVPKPEWMTEEEYDEIFDRYENVAVFTERKYKMELAIRMLEQKKKSELLRNGGGHVLPSAKRPNPFAKDDDFFRPKQVFDYSNGAPQVIDYGHNSSSGGGAKVPGNNAGEHARPGQGGDLPPRRFDYNHSQQGYDDAPFCVDRPPHYSESSTSKLAMMHRNPHPDQSNPSYPCKFILMNDNRPNRPSTKRGKRASSIRKQKLREQQQPKGQEVPSEQPSVPNPKPSDTADKPGPAVQPSRQLPRPFIPLDSLLPNMDALNYPEAEAEASPPPETPDVQLPMLQTQESFMHPAAMQDEPMSDYELEMKRGEPVVESLITGNMQEQCLIVPIEDLLMKPGRFQRPQKLCFVMRGLPGSGKSYLARMIKDCEVKQGGQAPRVLSLDDYFLVETEEREPDPKTGRPVLVTKSEYKFDGDMEDIYMQNLVKAFKRTITEDVFHFIIVDCPNEHLKYYQEFYAFARSNGFKVFTVTLQTEIDLCVEQNIHNRTADEIRSYANNWTLGPNDHPLINAGILFDTVDENQETVEADMDLCTEEDDGFTKDTAEEPPADNGGEKPAEQEDDSAKLDVDEDSNVDGPEPGWTALASRRVVPRP